MRTYYAIGAGLLLFLLPIIFITSWSLEAANRLDSFEADSSLSPSKIAVARQSNEAYCTKDLRKILRRVLYSCGLLQGRSGRGCQPMDAKKLATMSGDDFNALFIPMRGRGGIVQFDQGSDELDNVDRELVENVFAKRRGASYFFVVARASPEGAVTRNRELSRNRAENVLAHLKNTFNDPDLERQVGLLWLGEEYAQLEPDFCSWDRSGSKENCRPEDLNRSAFITWIDCRL